MSAVKHQPATPLPWRVEGDRIRATYVMSDAERAHYAEKFHRPIPEGETMNAVVGESEDNEYKVHAANAYPKQVRLARLVLNGMIDRVTLCKEALAVLSDLGEA